MDKKRYKFLQLPEAAFDRICEYLVPTDIKSLSLASHGLMSAIENVQKWVPRLHLLTINSIHQHKQAIRMIPELYPGSYLVERRELFENKQQEIISLVCSPASPPTYNEAQSASWSSALRFQRRREPDAWKRRVWICPHVGCKWEDIKVLTQQQNPPVSMYDTTPMLCPFPKCSLWARNMIITSSTTPATYEMCSTIKVYRRRCTSLDAVRRMLLNQSFRRPFTRAIKRLQLQICSHLDISSLQVLAGCNFDDILLLNGFDHSVDASLARSLQQMLDSQCYRICKIEGTYTTWSFFARYCYSPDLDAIWLDIEMMLCRPLFDCDEQNEYTSKHWKAHSCSGYRIAGYGIIRDSWARIVAEHGFDWRMPLPPAFLKQSSRGLLDLPSRT